MVALNNNWVKVAQAHKTMSYPKRLHLASLALADDIDDFAAILRVSHTRLTLPNRVVANAVRQYRRAR